MADLGNLLEEINNDDESIVNNEDQSYADEDLDNYDNQRSSSIPAAFTAAAAQRRKLDDEKDEIEQ